MEDKKGITVVIGLGSKGEHNMEEQQEGKEETGSLDFEKLLKQTNGEEPRDKKYWQDIVKVQMMMGGQPGDFTEDEILSFLEKKCDPNADLSGSDDNNMSDEEMAKHLGH